MAEIHKWKVVRAHEGDRFYREGEIREGTDVDLGHLEPKVLLRMDKTAPEPANKALDGAPANKGKKSRA